MQNIYKYINKNVFVKRAKKLKIQKQKFNIRQRVQNKSFIYF